jgi:hypothetical protein
MSPLHRYWALARVARRMTPRMALFMVRRVLRNRLAPRFPAAYRRRIEACAAHLPALAAGGLPPPAGLAAAAAHYCAEYRAMLPGLPDGRVTLNGHCVDFGAPGRIDWAHHLPEEGDHQMWRVKLSHMGFLCPLLASGTPAQQRLAATLARQARQQTDMAAKGAFTGFWFPYAASHRLLALGSGLAMARAAAPLPPEVEAELAAFLRLNAAFVLDNLEHELCNNHLERNLAGLCLYLSLAKPVPPALAARIERWVTDLLARTLLPDGTQIERSPMYQGLSVVSLGVMAEAPFLSAPLRARLHQHHQAARAAFAALCHPDGKVALFNDAWHDEVPRWDGPPAPEGRTVLPQGGYGRLAQGDDLCLMDAGPLGPSWNPGHGHADFLSVEISLGGARLIVDPGTSGYNTGPDRARERSAAAHNGPVWQGHEPVEFLGSFKVVTLAEAAFADPARLPPDTLAGLFCTGPGCVARAVRHWPGQGFLIADHWAGRASGQLRWLIPASWQVTPEDTGFALHHRASGRLARLVPLSAAQASGPEASVCASHYGRLDPANALTFQPASDPGSGTQSLLSWIGHGQPPEDAAAQGDALLRLLQTLSAPSLRK